MYIRLNWHEFIGTEFKGETVIGVFSPKFKVKKSNKCLLSAEE